MKPEIGVDRRQGERRQSEAPKSMDEIWIQGGRDLAGSVACGGSKNATLPVLAALLLADGQTRLTNVPNLMDVSTMVKMLGRFGVTSQRTEPHTLLVDTSRQQNAEAPYELVKTMRASIYVLGPLLARYGEARVSLPGGCAWGPRPVDLHIKGMEALGARVEIEHGYIVAHAPDGLRGGTISFDISSVGATGNILMAAATAAGTTTIENAACEPEIEALAKYLVAMGAKIDGIGTQRLVVTGVRELHPADAPMIPDRIEAGTLLAAAAVTGGDVEVTDVDPAHLGAVLTKFEAAGASVERSERSVRLRAPRRPLPVNVTTQPYPGFPTDMQAQFMALLSVADGASTIVDTIYHDRFTHVAELQRLGADIRVEGNTAFIQGVSSLSGAPVMATDLRASAALILAGLVAGGETRVSRVYHLDRGYERLEAKLAALGANVRRVRP
ncbi:MAG TPA: UDP-N-acetylglucosamine 1-carboxyvinyltransferase [Candidatus Eisenbacteria bacterium]|jgi:UDP-N-acetylglucosamine 1-carboxyvinyltransferase|nr:UDP-N-acetylglucosamine 1-carboxyvinyltransferase [Candidatus Eisenbacteria bacterium]